MITHPTVAMDARFNRYYSEDVCARRTPDQILYASASVAAFWLVSFSALADRRALRRQWRPVLLAVSVLSLDQRLVGQPLASNAVHETVEARQGVVLDVAFVQPEGKFIDVAAKVFLAGVVIDADRCHASGPRTRSRCHSWSRRRGHTRLGCD